MKIRDLIKTDKNGTQYFQVSCTCGKCGGSGIIGSYIPVNGGTCFDCKGTGVIHYTNKIMTPEYEKKLAENRAKAQAKKDAKRKAQAIELNKAFFEEQGFNSDGKTFAFIGNTYSIKDELKSMGARWHSASSLWILNHRVEGYKQVELDVSELFEADSCGVYSWRQWKLPEESTKQKIEKALHEDEKSSDYVGTEGQRQIFNVIYTNRNWFETPSYSGYGMTTTYVEHFIDSEGNQLVWKTQNPLNNVEQGNSIQIKATVKAHQEYKGVKQTLIQRVTVL